LAKTKVKPCPFCGCKVDICGSDCYPEEGYSYECRNLECFLDIHTEFKTREKATEEWNKRFKGD